MPEAIVQLNSNQIWFVRILVFTGNMKVTRTQCSRVRDRSRSAVADILGQARASPQTQMFRLRLLLFFKL